MTFEQIIGPIIQLIDTLFIYINSLVYDFISFVYQIFLALAGAQIFTSEQYQEIANRIYVIIGVVSLFLISYALLKAIVDPDGTAKSEYSVKKIIPNVLKVVFFIGITPVVFSMAYKLQNIIVTTDIIPKIIYDQNYGSSSNNSGGGTYDAEGREFANSIYTAFMYSKNGYTDEEIEINACHFPAPNCNGIEDSIEKLSDQWNPDDIETYTFAIAKKEVNEGKKNFQVYANFGSKMHGEKKSIEYNPIFQLIAGVITIYILLNFCIDLGVRAVKLGYYQLIAPVPILTILAPGQSKVFNNWLKSTVTTFIDVFFRIAVFFLGLLAIKYLPKVGDSVWANSSFATDTAVQNFARVFLIIGILIFIKQAPKLLSDLFGIQGGGFKLGIKDKLGEMVGIGGAVKRGLTRAEDATKGGLSGALGGAYGAFANKGNIRKGLKTGFWTGFKGGGNQFGKQLQNIYSQGGGKGVAGAFGGQKWSDRMSDRYKDQYKDDYQDRILSARVNSKTDYTDPKSLIHGFYKDQEAELTAKKQNEIVKTQQERDEAKQKLDDIQTKFESDKQAKLGKLQSALSGTDAVNSKRLVDGFESFNADKQAKLSGLKTEIDTAEAANVQALNGARANFESDKALKVKNIEAEMAISQESFNDNKNRQLGRLKQELESEYQVGNSTRVQQIQNQITTLEASQFDAAPYKARIRDVEGTRFDDTDVYKQMKIQQEEAVRAKKEEYEKVKQTSFEETSEYAALIANAKESEQNLYRQYEDVYNSSVEDTADYKEAKVEYETSESEYNQAFSDLNEKTEAIIRHVYDPDKKKLVKMVFNPHYEDNGLPKYVNADDEAMVEKVKVSAVEAKAFDNAVKDLKDKNETFKNEDTVLASRIRNKEDAEWLKSDEGRHMSMVMGKYFDKKMDKPSGPPKDDKK